MKSIFTEISKKVFTKKTVKRKRFSQNLNCISDLLSEMLKRGKWFVRSSQNSLQLNIYCGKEETDWCDGAIPRQTEQIPAAAIFQWRRGNYSGEGRLQGVADTPIKEKWPSVLERPTSPSALRFSWRGFQTAAAADLNMDRCFEGTSRRPKWSQLGFSIISEEQRPLKRLFETFKGRFCTTFVVTLADGSRSVPNTTIIYWTVSKTPVKGTLV